MDVVLLRTLAMKSVLRYGKYHDLTVEEVIRYKGIKGFKFLTWAYYRSSNISFNQEILDILGITKENEITKPGKCTSAESYKYECSAIFNRIKNDNLPDQQKEQISRMNRKKTFAEKKAKSLAEKAWLNKYNNKRSNQYRNQNKYKS